MIATPQTPTYACFRGRKLHSGVPRVWFMPRPPLQRTYCRVPGTATFMGGNQDDAGDARKPVLLTIDEAAELLRISKWKLYDYIHNRQLKTVKFGSRRLIPMAALQVLIDRLSDQEAL